LNCSECTIEITAGGVLRLSGAVDTYSATELRDQLALLLKEHATPSVDLSELEACDFTTIQLLFAARRWAEGAGKPFIVAGISDAVRRTCAELGLSPKLFTGEGSE